MPSGAETLPIRHGENEHGKTLARLDRPQLIRAWVTRADQ